MVRLTTVIGSKWPWLGMIGMGFIGSAPAQAELLRYTKFSHAQLSPRGNGEVGMTAKLANKKQSLGDSNDTLRQSEYSVSLAYRVAKNVILGGELSGSDGQTTRLSPSSSDLGTSAFGAVDQKNGIQDLTAFGKFQVPLKKAKLLFSAAYRRQSLERQETTKLFSQGLLLSRSEEQTSADLDRGTYGLAFSQGNGTVGLSFSQSAKDTSLERNFYLPRENSVYAAVNIMRNMEIGAAVTQNIYDQVGAEASDYKDYNLYRLASKYRWKNKKVHSLLEISDSPIIGSSGYSNWRTQVYFGVKASRNLELGANLSYESERYAVNDVNNREREIGMGIEAMFIL